MKKLLLFLFAISFLSIDHLQAQAPGFMGKRFFVMANSGYNVLQFQTVDQRRLHKVSLPFSARANYVVGRRSYLSLEYNSLSQLTNRSAQEQISGLSTVDIRTSMRSLGLTYYRTFNRRKQIGTLAPIGVYTGFGLYQVRRTTSPKEYYLAGDGTQAPTDIEAFYEDNFSNAKQKGVGIKYEVGHNAIFADRFIWSFSYSTNIAYLQEDIYAADEQKPIYSPNYWVINDDVFLLDIYLQLGVGVLLF